MPTLLLKDLIEITTVDRMHFFHNLYRQHNSATYCTCKSSGCLVLIFYNNYYLVLLHSKDLNKANLAELPPS